jgi:outer membrane protein assembly factor BamB
MGRRWALPVAVLVVCLGCSPPSGHDAAPSPSPPPAAPSSAAPAGAATAAGDWPAYHRDAAGTGYAAGTPPLSRLARAWSARLDGAVYGQPLVVAGTVLAATLNNTVYGLALADGHVLWQRHLGSPVPLSSLPCGDVDPLGILSTPAFDPQTGRVFVLAEVSGKRHVLFGLNAHTGAVELTRPVEPPRGKPGDHQQRSALAVGNGRVYVAFGGLYGDCADYIGSVVGIPTDGNGPPVSYAVPTPREGGVWSPAGPVLDAAGTLLVATGNGEVTDPGQGYDGSDSVIELSPGLAKLDLFAPSSWAEDNAADLDLGSVSPALVGGYVYINGKSRTAYLLDPNHLGGVGGERASREVCAAFGGTAVVENVVYVPCTDGVRSVTVGPGPKITIGWRTSSRANGPPVVGGGAVWSVAWSWGSPGGTLYALDPATGAPRASVPVGDVPHFVSPTLSGDRVLVGTLSGVVAFSGA